MALTAAEIFRDYETDGVPASGHHDPKKSKIRQLLGQYEQIINAFTSNGGLIYSSKAAMDADLDHADNTMAWVVGDAVAANNGIYRKIVGGWVRMADLPYGLILAEDTGEGTPNAIQATSSLPVVSSALVLVNVYEANTGSPVTIAFNGGSPLTVKSNSGNDIAAGGLVSGSLLLGRVSGTTFRLVSDQASSAFQAIIEGLVEDAEAAAQAAIDAASSVQLTEFATKAAAEAYAPDAAPTYLRTAFYDGDRVPGSGALYANNGTSTGDLVITLADGVTEVGYSIKGDVISATAFGLKSTATAAANLAAIKATIAATPSYASWAIPDVGADIIVDTTGGLTNAAEIDRPMTCYINGRLKANYAVREANPAFMFNVTADGVRIFGRGSIEGDGTTFSDGLDGNNVVYPGLVYVSGDKLSWSGVNIIKPPMMGIYLAAANDCNLWNFSVVGGHVGYETSTIIDPSDPDYGDPNPAYDGSYHVGVVMSGGGGHSCRSIRFVPGDDGGAVIQGFFNAGDLGVANGVTIAKCKAKDPWEKLFYMYGDDHILVNNRVEGTWGGAFQASCHTDVFRLMGSRILCQGNVAKNVQGGVQSLNGNSNKILDNRIFGSVGVAINVEQQAGEPSISLSEIKNNTVTFQGSSSLAAPAGIRVYCTDADVLHIDVSQNHVVGFGKNGVSAAIDLDSASGVNIYQPTVDNNTVIDYGDGVRVSRSVNPRVKGTALRVGTGRGVKMVSCGSGEVSDTTGVAVGAWALSQSGCSGVRFANNNTRGATNIGIEGLSGDNYGVGNQYTDAPLAGSATLAASVTNTITHGGVAPNAVIMLTPASSAVAIAWGADGYWADLSGNNFAISRGNGNASAVGNMNYQIIQ